MRALLRFGQKAPGWGVLLAISVCLVSSVAWGQQSGDISPCLLQLLQTAADHVTVGELRALCRQRPAEEETPAAESPAEPVPAVSERLAADEASVLKPFTFMSHRPNYILLGALNFSGYQWPSSMHSDAQDDPQARDFETQFQISMKFPLAIGLLDTSIDLYAAYTNRSFWQLYAKDASSPFRETNHEPEIWLQMPAKWHLAGFHNAINAIGFAHQSNGKGGELSRSWNRIYANAIFEKGDLAVAIKPWIRIPESEEDDDNPDITDYLGHGELRVLLHHKGHTLSLMLRNHLESGFEKGAVELGWSFPFGDYRFIKGYIQFFSGYGESLIDYDRYVNRLGVGLLLHDWL